MVQKPLLLKLPRHMTPYVFAFYMATIMAFLMCSIITWAQFGFTGDYFANVLKAYRVAMPSAFVCVLLARPVVMRLVALSVRA